MRFRKTFRWRKEGRQSRIVRGAVSMPASVAEAWARETPKRAAAGILGTLAAGAVGAMLAAAGASGSAAAHEPELSRYTYWRDIRPLMERRCASCHSGSGPAPVNLMRYADALPWANSIARQVLERRMPPWLPEDGTGDLAHARTLDERETDMLVDWAIGLAPEGNPPSSGKGTASPEAAPAEATMPPAQRLTLEAPVRIGALDSETTVCAPLLRGEGVGEAATGFALLPGEAVSILRRAVLLVGEDCESAAPLFTWVVGQGPRMRPAGIFDPLPADAGLFLRLAYRKGFDTEGLAFEDAPEVAVFPARPDRGAPVRMRPVEPGATRLGPAALLAVLPPEGLDPGPDGFAVELLGSDGEATPLLRIRRFDPDWSEKFAFAAPVPLDDAAAIRVSHPGAILDLVRPPPAEDGERQTSETRRR